MITRREFLGNATLGLVSMAFFPDKILSVNAQIPQTEKLGRVTAGMVEVKARPDYESNTVAKVYQDNVVSWQQEVIGRMPYRRNQRWVQTPQGYIWAASLQPVKNLPNTPLTSLPESGSGFWAEVSVPYVDLILDNPPARSPWMKEAQNPRLFYTQVFWIDQIRQDEQGGIWYRVNERYGYGDLFWAKAEAFRPLSQDEIAPIHPEADEKRVVVNIERQTISCFEGKNEVYFALVSTGMRSDINGNRTEKWETPLGIRPIWRKLLSVHMSGGTTGGGYDLPGVSWTSLFEGSGVAIHSTFWHNNFGEEMSHGCVNAAPDDAKWIFRWTNPIVGYDPGDVTVGMPGGTVVEVMDS